MPRGAGRAAAHALRRLRRAPAQQDAQAAAPRSLPSLDRLYAGTSLAEPLTRGVRTDLELLRRSNTSLLDLEGRVIRARVIRIDKRFALLDTGFKKVARYDRRSLLPSQLVGEAPGGEPRGPGEFRRGDVLEFRVTAVESPFGDMQMHADTLPGEDARTDALWDELEDILAARKQVMGRMLNTVTGGYAVGVAGVIAFLPFSSCSLVSAGRIGQLQTFYISSMQRAKRNIILIDSRIAESSSYRGLAGSPTFASGSRCAPRRACVSLVAACSRVRALCTASLCSSPADSAHRVRAGLQTSIEHCRSAAGCVTATPVRKCSCGAALLQAGLARWQGVCPVEGLSGVSVRAQLCAQLLKNISPGVVHGSQCVSLVSSVSC